MDLTTLTDTEARDLLAQAYAEVQRRDAIGPGVAVTWTDGNRWRNKSGTWLPKTASPGTYPMGWTQETGLPTAGAWRAGVSYKVGDLATDSSKTYRALQAHTSQVGWNPSAVPALWTLA